MMSLKVRTILIGTLATLGLGASLNAAALSLEPVLVFHAYQQTANSPCVIGESSCQDGVLPDHTVLPVATSYDDVFSPEYTVQQIFDAVGFDFWVGFDVNQTNVVQTLDYFKMYINGSEVDVYTGPTGVPPTTGGGNGNGYADYLFKGFTSLSGYDLTDTVQFQADMSLVNDGREQFFLITAGSPPAPPEVPEPSSLLLMGGGLVGLAWWRKRRNS
jgi:hypothetical protein